MKITNVEEKLDKFINNRTTPDVENVMVFRTNDSKYELYNQYQISKVSPKEYEVTMKNTHVCHSFYQLKNAVAWCTYDKRNKIKEASTILNLDLKLYGADANAEVYDNLTKNAKTVDSKLVYVAKLTEEKEKKNHILRQLNHLINEAKSWQLAKFNTKPLQ